MHKINEKELRIYDPDECVVFCKTKEAFGGYSNMCAGYPLVVNDIDIRTSEALYQACRFPNHPNIQKIIISQKSPMSAKMKSKPHRKDKNRSCWEFHRIPIMRWCLRVKLLQNWDKFSKLLIESGDLPIVERSNKKDQYWAATVNEDGKLVGQNFMGRLTMELRESLITGKDLMMIDNLTVLRPPAIENFFLYGEEVREIRRK